MSQPNEIAVPSFKDTFVYRGPKFLYNKTIGRVFNAQTPDHAVWEANGEPLDDIQTMLIEMHAKRRRKARRR